MRANGLGCSGQGFACVCAAYTVNTKCEEKVDLENNKMSLI